MRDERIEPDELDPSSQPTLTSLTSTGSVPAWGSLAGEPHPNIGAYRILGLVGQGGMGIVYRAEQQSPQRIVALKVIRLGVASAEHLRRFEQEAKLLGRLQHPGIARIYEAGTANSGSGDQPYFAMEFIDGWPLLQHVNKHNLDTGIAWN
jgi:serine/threonine protein kinase